MTPQEIREFRQRHKLTSEQLAHLVGVSTGRRVRYWESGERIPSIAVVILMRIYDRSRVMRAMIRRMRKSIKVEPDA